MHLMNIIYLRFVFCALATVTFIAVFYGVLYFEMVSSSISDRSRQLIHHRYLEYFRSFLWGVAFILVGYLSWEIGASDSFEKLGVPSRFSSIVGLLQLATIFGGGIVLVMYGFHTKLKEIEGENLD